VNSPKCGRRRAVCPKQVRQWTEACNQDFLLLVEGENPKISMLASALLRSRAAYAVHALALDTLVLDTLVLDTLIPDAHVVDRQPHVTDRRLTCGG
jgi:hypothetical protein